MLSLVFWTVKSALARVLGPSWPTKSILTRHLPSKMRNRWGESVPNAVNSVQKATRPFGNTVNSVKVGIGGARNTANSDRGIQKLLSRSCFGPPKALSLEFWGSRDRKTLDSLRKIQILELIVLFFENAAGNKNKTIN